MSDTLSLPTPAHPGVRIRMYRQGLGDCFLLTFFGAEKPRQVLIDCGVFGDAPGAQKKMQAVAADIARETDSRLDALVVSHEHWDHVGGFSLAQELFDPMKIGEIWLAWTENPNHPAALAMKRYQRLKLQAASLALARLSQGGDRRQLACGEEIAGLLGFFGEAPSVAALMAFSQQTAAAMAKVTRREPPPTFWQAGDLIEPDWLPGVRFFVLGPPPDMAAIKQGEGRPGKDTYGLTGAQDSLLAALEGVLGEGEGLPEPGRLERRTANLPFHASLQWRDEGLIRKHPALGPLHRQYSAPVAAWRRIDQDWLFTAARLALQIDGYTNNTSLVLAVELMDTGRILLFPGDAQIASWKSWQSLNWQSRDGGTVRTPDLLRRTVFYKVGHHGSHNATLKEQGLELMTNPGLVAAIPTDRELANRKRWQMPAAALKDRLLELTRGRLLFADSVPNPEPPSSHLSQEEWEQFLKAVFVHPEGLYLDYYL